MLKSNLLCAFIALITAVTISSAFAHGYLSTFSPVAMNEDSSHSLNN
ncbi:MAG: hypothetical protein H7336_04005 [Bacteriovorax sp.]|nr:hypothetical protein [Bacteriovorax sp.]